MKFVSKSFHCIQKPNSEIGNYIQIWMQLTQNKHEIVPKYTPLDIYKSKCNQLEWEYKYTKEPNNQQQPHLKWASNHIIGTF